MLNFASAHHHYESTLRLTAKKKHADGFNIRYVEAFPTQAVDDAIQRCDAWVAQAAQNARVVVLTRLKGFDTPVVVKLFPAVQTEDVGRGSKDSRIRQLGPRYAANEAKNLMALRQAGAGTPTLYAWGEQRQRLLRQQGIMIMEYVDQPDLGKRLAAGDTSWVEAAVIAIAKLHNAGLVHRDCYPRNLFERDGEILMIDLETVGRIKPKRRLGDLTRLLVPLWIEGENSELMHSAFALYCEHADVYPSQAEWLAAAERKYERGLHFHGISEHSHLINEL